MILGVSLCAILLSSAKSSKYPLPPGENVVQCSNSCPDDLSATCSDIYGESCPPGLFCKDGHCKCAGVYPNHFISCNGSSSMVLRSFCVTFDSNRDLTLVGNCIRTLSRGTSTVDYASDRMYHELPRNVRKLNDMMCKPLNKTGTLCGRCLPDHYPLAYSFNMKCIPCPNARWNWVRYIMAAYLPLTLFYIAILFFQVNVTSSHLFPVVYYCQTVSMPLLLRSLFLEVDADGPSSYFVTAKVFFSLYGVWNLDFFRSYYSDLCLGIGILPTLALDYAIAVYPLLLMIISYLLLYLYDRNYRIIVCMWKPFRVLLSLFKRNWDIRTSLIDAFATFFFLSNIKLLSVSFDLLVSTQVYELYPDHYNYTLGVYYAGDIEYFGREHLPYAILALIMLLVFIVLPSTILALYQFTYFQKFLDLFPGVRWYILHTFVDLFQGCYKNGTQPGTRDYRWFASVHFIVRLGYFIMYFLTDKVIFLSLATMVQVLHITLLATLLPFKSSIAHYNAINIVFLQFLTLFGLTSVVVCFTVFLAPQFLSLFYVLSAIFGCIPLLYATAIMVYLLYTHKRVPLNVLHRLKAWKNGYNQIQIPERGIMSPA